MPPRRHKQKGGAGDAFDNIARNAQIIGQPGSNYVQFTLQPGEAILCQSGSMLFMKGNMDKSEVHIQSATSVLGRIFSGESFFLEKYGARAAPSGGGLLDFFKKKDPTPQAKVATKYAVNQKTVPLSMPTTGPGYVSVGTFLPADILMIAVQPKQEILLSRGSFLACTPNIEVSAGVRMRGIFEVGQEEGFVLPRATCTDDNVGYIWVAAYGTFEKHEIQDGDALVVNNGLFLACDAAINYEIVTVGKSLLGSLFGGGLGMKYTGPCTIYTQSKNMNDFVEFIAMRTGTTAETGGIVGAVAGVAAESIVDGVGEGIGDMVDGMEGGKKKRKPRKKNK